MNQPSRHIDTLPGLELNQDFHEKSQIVHEEWAAKTPDDIAREFVDSTVHPNITDPNQSVRYADLRSKDDDPDEVGFMALPAGKIWNPETFVMASIVKRLTLPNGRLLVFPNNNLGQTAYTLSKEERAALKAGDFSPISNRQYDAIHGLGVSSLRLVLGRSLGAALGASFASQAAEHDIQLHATHFDEAPNTYDDGARSGFGLRWSVTREGSQLIPEYRAAEIPAYDRASGAYNYFAFQAGLAKFLVGGNFKKPNADINKAFLTPNFFENVTDMLVAQELATVSLSNASNSTVGDKDATHVFVDAINTSIRGDIATYTLYGDETRKAWHATAVNPFVLGRLGYGALKWNEQVEIPGLDHGFVGHVEHEMADPDQDDRFLP